MRARHRAVAGVSRAPTLRARAYSRHHPRPATQDAIEHGSDRVGAEFVQAARVSERAYMTMTGTARHLDLCGSIGPEVLVGKPHGGLAASKNTDGWRTHGDRRVHDAAVARD